MRETEFGYGEGGEKGGGGEESALLIWIKRLRLGRTWRAIERVVESHQVDRNEGVGQPSWKDKVLGVPVIVTVLSLGEARRDDIPKMASNLAFFSVLSVVPMLSVVTSLLGAFGVFEPRSGNLSTYLELLFPAVGRSIVGYLQEFSARGASIGGVSTIVLLVVSIFLFNNIERALTHIWHGRSNRPIVAKFLMFYAALTLGPVFMILSVLQTASAQLFLSAQLGIGSDVFDQVLPIFYAFVVFTFVNKVLPHAYVRWSSATVAGAVTALAFEGAKWGFNQYVNVVLVDSYDKLYGALGIVPLFMIWVYVIWVVILMASKVAYCAQHMGRLVGAHGPLSTVLGGGQNGGSKGEHFVGVLTTLEVLTPVVVSYKEGKGPLREDVIGELTGYAPGLVREVVDEMVRMGVLTAVTKATVSGSRHVVPGKPLEDIKLGEVVRHFLSGQTGMNVSKAVGQVRWSHRENLYALLAGKTAVDLADDAGASELVGQASGGDTLKETLEEEAAVV